MRKSLLIVGFLMLNLEVMAQSVLIHKLTASISLLEKTTPSFARDTQLVNVYYETARLFMYQNIDTLHIFAKKTFSLAEKTNWEKGKTLGYRLLAHYYLLNGRFYDALESAGEGMNLARKLALPSEQAQATRLVADCQAELKQFDLARANYQKTLPFFQSIKADSMVAVCYWNMGDLYRGKKEYAKAQLYYNKARKGFENLSSKNGLACVLGSEGYMYVMQAQFEAALLKYEPALELFKELHNRYGQLCVLNEIANTYLSKHDFKNAIFYGQQSLKQAQLYNSSQQIYWAMMPLYEANSLTGNYKEALRYAEMVRLTKEKLLEENVEERLVSYQLKYESQQKDVQLKQQTIESQELTTRFLIGFMFMLGAVAFLLFLNNHLLRRQNAEIQTALLTGQTLERKRVAVELHDNVGGTLAGVRWYLSTLDQSSMNAQEKETYDSVTGMLTNAYDEVRLLSHNLLPEELEQEGLLSALQRLMQKLNRSDKLRFELTVNGLDKRLDRKTEFEIYSIVLELTNNIIKHAKASQAVVSLLEEKEKLTLTVQDDGQGFTHANEQGMGLRNVRGRVESLNGTIIIKSQDAQGTLVKAEIPRH